MPLGQKCRVWEMCTQPNIVPRPSTSLFAKSFFVDINRARKQHELLEYIEFLMGFGAEESDENVSLVKNGLF